MSDASFFEVAESLRACRSFTADAVDDAMVERILRASTHAPSAENAQPWVFVVVRDDSLRRAIGELTTRAWERGGRDFERDRLPKQLYADVEQGATGGIADAPVLVVVGADTERCLPTTIGASIFPAVQNFLLAAHALGLGSALTTLPTLFGDELRTLLQLPEHIAPVAVLPLGYPAQPLGAPRRHPVEASTHRNRFGTPW